VTTPRQARTRELMIAMLAVGFCLGALATTWLAWRRDALGIGKTAPAAPSAGASSDASPPSPTPPPDDDGTPAEEEIERTAPAVGPAVAPGAGAVAATGTDREILRGKRLRIPVDGVVHAALQPSFDQARGARRHEAIDILSPRGTPVRAVEGGTVGKLFTSDRGGLTIYQYDPTGTYCYYYAHLDRYAEGLREGQTLGAGDVVGYVGTTGNAPPDTPHLHFAIFRMSEAGRWWEGTPIDPYDVLQ
jgi:peptidoglycan LD-endopeptidase LytH